MCRDDTGEPLIRPCLCSGSMSGVHASCVETWIQHHRANSPSGEMPKCSVCGMEYMGTERRPGILSFLSHLGGDFMKQACRSSTLVFFLVAYWAAAQEELIMDLVVRISFFVASGLFFMYKAMVLSFSVPRGRPAPDNCERYFFSSDPRVLAVNFAEVMAIIIIALIWCVFGQLRYQYVLPLGILAIIPFLFLILRGQQSPFSYQTLVAVLVLIASPFLVIFFVIRLLFQNPKRLFDPFEGWFHFAVPVASVPLSWFCRSNEPLILLWICHGALLLTGLMEMSLIKVCQWKEGRSWWIFLQLSLLAAYIANLLHNFTDGFLGEHSQVLVVSVSGIWLILSATIAFSVNWGICVRQFRAWQHRNGQFSLSPAGNSPGSSPGAQQVGRPQQEEASPPV